jgi:hypothetical protein
VVPKVVYPLYSCGFQRHTIISPTAIFNTIFDSVRERAGKILTFSAATTIVVEIGKRPGSSYFEKGTSWTTE